MRFTTYVSPAEAMWRLEVLTEIEKDGFTLCDRQVQTYREALAIVNRANPADLHAPPVPAVVERKSTSGKGTGPGKAPVRKLSNAQLTYLRRELPRRNTTALAVQTVSELLARCDRDGTDPLTVVPMRLASDALSNLFGAPFLPRNAVTVAPSAPQPAQNPTPGVSGTPVAQAGAEPVQSEGVYRGLDGDIYRVKRSRTSGRLYAQKWNDATNSYDYAKGMLNCLDASWLLTGEELAALGKRTTFCMDCGTKLENQESIDRGRGPVCSGEGYRRPRK